MYLYLLEQFLLCSIYLACNKTPHWCSQRKFVRMSGIYVATWNHSIYRLLSSLICIIHTIKAFESLPAVTHWSILMLVRSCNQSWRERAWIYPIYRVLWCTNVCSGSGDSLQLMRKIEVKRFHNVIGSWD